MTTPNHSSTSTPPSGRRNKVIAVSVALGILGAGGYLMKTEKTAPPAQAQRAAVTLPRVVVAQVKDSVLTEKVDLYADLVSLTSPQLSAEVSGRVQSVLVKPGDSVVKGQVLAIQDASDLTYAALDTNAQLSQIATVLAEKERSLENNENLLEKGYVARSSVESERADVRATRQQLTAYKARALQAQTNLSKTRVVAPFSGTIESVSATPGAFARVGDPLFVLSSPKESYVKLAVPQALLGSVNVGDAVEIRWKDQKLESTVEAVKANIDKTSRSFEARAATPAALATATGASVVATLSKKPISAPTVPVSALQLEGTASFVYVLEGTKAVRKAVTVGLQQDGQAAIVEGLKAGDPVVVEGGSFIKDGQQVEVQQEGTSK